MTKEQTNSWELAKRFHDLYEKYAPDFGYSTREDTKEFDPETPNGKLMTKVCDEVISQEKEKMIEEFKKQIEDIDCCCEEGCTASVEFKDKLLDLLQK